MKKNVAVLFTQGPHGSSAGLEGLDALLAISSFATEIGVFFVSDGVMHLVQGQNPACIGMRDYIVTFGLLNLYEINHCYACEASIGRRGIIVGQDVVAVEKISAAMVREKLAAYHTILTF